MNNEQAFIRAHPLYVFAYENIYSVIIYEADTVKKSVAFNADREYDCAVGMELQDIDRIDGFVGKKVNEIKDCFGEFHVDIGSGFYIPTLLQRMAF